MKYVMQITASVANPDTDFKAGFELYVENGGDFSNVGNAVQTAIDQMKDKGTPKKVETENK